ncbi:MAG: YbjN domain-containing protein [Saprospiraceae bacterium]
MQKFLFTLALIGICQVADLNAQLMTEPDHEVIEEVLFSLGIAAKRDDTRYTLSMQNKKVLLVVGDTWLQLYAGFQTDAEISVINTFNQEYKWCRAYLDNDGDPCLESDISYIGGMTEMNLRSFFSTYDAILAVFLEKI